MVNRQQLQNDIDRLLESITDDEIILWYDSKTKIDIMSYLGHGAFLEIKPCSDFIQQETTYIQTFRSISDIDPEQSDPGSSIFGIAA